SCSSKPGPAPSPVDLSRDLAGKVKVDAPFAHLRQLQEIANANKGSRADGTAGYDASVDYVVKLLSEKGFDVSTPEASRLATQQPGTQTLIVGERKFTIDQASLLVQTPAGGLSVRAEHPAKPAGCAAGDYAGTAVKGAIAVTDDQACSIVDKQNAALANGAVALLVMSGKSVRPGLFTPGYYRQLTVPVGVIGTDADAAVRRTNASVRLTLESKAVLTKSRNVLAQTKTGSARNVVLVGAHLDSAEASPGINDDGSGVAAVLETALQLGSSPSVTNAVRFCFWAAAEQGVGGSTSYLSGLSNDQLDDIALYLNFDQLASANAGYFTYDGDQSGQASVDVPAERVPAGSAGVERTLAGYLNLAGRRPADLPLGGTADYFPFLTAGVPIGGVTTWATGKKSPVQARLWDGAVGQPFDPYYHLPGDTLEHVNRDALAVTGPAVAFAVGTYALSTDGVNGVPPRDGRHRLR
ncbi:MAG: hypothetical protein QOH57_2422, partial [Mycobacterium sp.]|nr:hypothetical protein [Mycobacterium sp.]